MGFPFCPNRRAVDSGSDLLHCYHVSVFILRRMSRNGSGRSEVLAARAPTKVIHSFAKRRRPIASHRID